MSHLAHEVAVALLSPSANLRVIFVVHARFFLHFDRWLGVSKNALVIPYTRFFSPRLILKLVRPDVIVSPLFGVEPFLHSDPIPHIVSIPDTLALDHPELFLPAALRQRRQSYERAASATMIVTVSEFSRVQLHKHFPVLNVPVEVVELSGDQFSLHDDARPTAAPYIFYPANSWKHKRHELLLQAMQRIWRIRPEIKLVLSGGRPPDVDLSGLIAQYAPAGAVIDLAYTTDAQLSAAYAHAEAMIFTSQYEGFGMPLLEAMKAGCPVICASVAAIPEIAGDAAIYVMGDNPDDWAAAFLEQLPQEKDALIARGYKRASLFTWAQTRDKWTRAVLNAANLSSAIG